MKFEERIERGNKLFKAARGRLPNSAQERIGMGMQAAWIEFIDREINTSGGIDLPGVCGGLGRAIEGIMHGLILSEKQLNGADSAELLRSCLIGMLGEIKTDVSAEVPADEVVKAGPVMSARPTLSHGGE